MCGFNVQFGVSHVRLIRKGLDCLSESCYVCFGVTIMIASLGMLYLGMPFITADGFMEHFHVLVVVCTLLYLHVGDICFCYNQNIAFMLNVCIFILHFIFFSCFMSTSISWPHMYLVLCIFTMKHMYFTFIDFLIELILETEIDYFPLSNP